MERGTFLAEAFFGNHGNVDLSSPTRTLVGNKNNLGSLTPGYTVSPTKKKPRCPLDSNENMSVATLQTPFQNLCTPPKKPDSDNQQPPLAASNTAHQQEPPAISRLHYDVGAANQDNHYSTG